MKAVLCDLCLHVLPPLFEQLVYERDARTTLCLGVFRVRGGCLLHDLRLGTPYVNIIANLKVDSMRDWRLDHPSLLEVPRIHGFLMKVTLKR